MGGSRELYQIIWIKKGNEEKKSRQKRNGVYLFWWRCDNAADASKVDGCAATGERTGREGKEESLSFIYIPSRIA